MSEPSKTFRLEGDGVGVFALWDVIRRLISSERMFPPHTIFNALFPDKTLSISVNLLRRKILTCSTFTSYSQYYIDSLKLWLLPITQMYPSDNELVNDVPDSPNSFLDPTSDTSWVMVMVLAVQKNHRPKRSKR